MSQLTTASLVLIFIVWQIAQQKLKNGETEYEVKWIGRPDTYYSNYCPFSNNKTITSVVLSSTVIAICYHAFEGCTNLTTVTLKSVKVVTVDAESFKDCGAIEVRVPSDLVDAYKANATWAAITTNIVAL